jgi:hypothetical protein
LGEARDGSASPSTKFVENEDLQIEEAKEYHIAKPKVFDAAESELEEVHQRG